MSLDSIIKNSAVFTDENFSFDKCLSIANRAISRINTDCKTLFPKYISLNAIYNSFPDDWQMELISSYLSYGIKMNDSARNEGRDYLEEFSRSLLNFKSELGTLLINYTEGDIVNGVNPEIVKKEGFGGVYGLETSGAINVGFFGYNGNGGSF